MTEMREETTPDAAPTDGVAAGPRLQAPSVLVVITCRNYGRFVGEAIRSVAAQRYRNLQCVVIDDCSSDDSVQMIATVLAELGDARFSVIALDRNVGQLSAFRVGMKGRPSHLVAFLDADDFWFPDFLVAHVRAHLNTICAAPFSASDTWLIDGRGTALEATYIALAKRREGVTFAAGVDLPPDCCPAISGGDVLVEERPALTLRYIPPDCSGWHWVNTSSMVFKRHFADIAIPADGEPSRRHADYFLAYLGHFLGGSLIIPQSLGVYRMHQRNLFAGLPRIGSFQRVGIDPRAETNHTHERLVLHVLRRWHLFTTLTSEQVVGEGLRRFMRWNKIEALGRANGVDKSIVRAAGRAARKARIRAKPKRARPLARLGDLVAGVYEALRARRRRTAEGKAPQPVRAETRTPAPATSGGWGCVLFDSPMILMVKPTFGAPMGIASTIAPSLRDRDVTLVTNPSWSFELDDHRAGHVKAFRTYLEAYPRHRLCFMGNTAKEVELMQAEGFRSIFINQGCLMNDQIFKPLPDTDPSFDAINVSRLSAEKRPHLASQVESLAMVFFHSGEAKSVAQFHAEYARLRLLMPRAAFVNKLTAAGCERLTLPQVNEWLSRARVGLCLSPVEGAMRASIEYMLAGLSVVSTPSLGGRDYFFDEEFCIIAEPDPESIRDAVAALVRRNVPKEHVRRKTLQKVEVERARFIDFVQSLIDEKGGRERFEPRFRELVHGPGVVPWRSGAEMQKEVDAARARADATTAAAGLESHR